MRMTFAAVAVAATLSLVGCTTAVKGVVRDRATRQGIAGCTLEIRETEEQPRTLARVQTGIAGDFYARVPSRSAYLVVVNADRYVDVAEMAPVAASGDCVFTVELDAEARP